MRTLLFAIAFVLSGAVLWAQEPPERPVDLSTLRVVLVDYDWREPIPARLVSTQAHRSFGSSAWFAADDFRVPYARVRSIEARTRAGREITITATFLCLGEEDPERHILVELRALDKQDRVVRHTWSLEGDQRIVAAEHNARDSRERLFPENRTGLSIPTELLPEVSTLEIGLRPMSGRELEHFPRQPHELKFAMTRSDDDGHFEFVFTNHPGWDLDPAKHEIAFRVNHKDAEGRTVDRSVQFLPYRADGRYRVKAAIPPAHFPHSTAYATIYTKQPDNEAFRQKFFVRGEGSSYKGAWTGDGGKLIEIPFVDSKYR